MKDLPVPGRATPDIATESKKTIAVAVPVILINGSSLLSTITMNAMIKSFLTSKPVGPGIYDFGLLIWRVFFGLTLALGHGLGKLPPSEQFVGWLGTLGFPLPGLFAWFAAIAEFGGGILVALGLATRLGATLVILIMLGAVTMAHGGQSFGEKEHALLFLVGAIPFLLGGPGRFSVDHVLRG